MAKLIKSKKIDINLISEITGLTIDEIKNSKKLLLTLYILLWKNI